MIEPGEASADSLILCHIRKDPVQRVIKPAAAVCIPKKSKAKVKKASSGKEEIPEEMNHDAEIEEEKKPAKSVGPTPSKAKPCFNITSEKDREQKEAAKLQEAAKAFNIHIHIQAMYGVGNDF